MPTTDWNVQAGGNATETIGGELQGLVDEATAAKEAAEAAQDAAEQAATDTSNLNGRTRAEMVALIAGGFVPVDGTTYFADGLAYLGQTGATAIPDLPGLVPAPLVASIAWDDVTDKPATFPPSAHTHPVSAISDSTAAGRAMVTAADAAAQRTLLSVETTTQLNARDTANRARSAHTGTQPASTITGLAAVATSGDYDDLSGLPTLGGAAALDIGTTAGTVAAGNDARLSDDRGWTAATVAQIEAETGTATNRRAWTAQRVRQAIVAWWAGSADKAKLDGIASGATANASDADLRARASHTGTQLASTISDFSAAVAATAAVTANTAKVSNATHTGDVTGSTVLTIANDAVNNVKLADMAASTIKGRASAGTGDPQDLTATQVRTILNVADGATANASDAALRDRASHTGAQAISTVTGLQSALDGKQPLATVLTNTTAAFTTAQETKLAGIATGATANSPDATLLDRANHTGTQAASTITGLATVATSGDYADLSGLPTLGGAAALDVGTTAGTVAAGNDSRMTNSREWTASTVLQAEAEAGTATTRRAFTAQRVRQAILAWWNGSAEKTKLDGIATGATANASDSALRDRATHTGEQAISTVTDLQTALDKKASALATYKTSVGDFLPGRTDLEAFQAAIDSLPDADDFGADLGTLDDGELPAYEIFIPLKPAGVGLTAGEYYTINGRLNYGKRNITWVAETGARIGAVNNGWTWLSAPLVQERGIHMPGYSNRKEAANLTLTSGPGALDEYGHDAKISAYDPNTVDTQAYQHERGRAALYVGVGDGSELNVPGTGVTYGASSVSFSPAFTPPSNYNIRTGMVIDTVGDMLSGSPLRHTTRVVSVTWSGSSVTSIEVEPWRRMVAMPPFTSSELSTPPNGTALIINPCNKVWGANINISLDRLDGATYGYTSGSCIEAGIFNKTGERFGTEFDRDTHPLHFWGVDMPHLGDYGGGIACIVRGQQTWDRAFENRSAEIGFHNHGTQFNDGKLAFVSSSGFDGAYAGWGTGTPAYDFLARSRIGGVWDNQFAVVGGTPTVELGRKGSASTPRLRFYADGLAGSDSALWDAEIATTSTNGGTLILDAKHDTIMRWNGNDRLRVTSTGVSVAGLVTGGAVTQSSTDATAGRLLKVGDFGLGGQALNVSDFNNAGQHNRMIFGTDSVTNAPFIWPAGWQFTRADNRRTQFVLSSIAGIEKAAFRNEGSGGFGPWREFFHTGNLLGTVSQSGGVPTGAVIERGFNANGSYVRYADGTQMCWIFRSDIVACDIAISSGGFRSNGIPWTFPSAFSTAPAITGLAVSAAIALSANSSTASGEILYLTVNSSASATRSAFVSAIGRWF